MKPQYVAGPSSSDLWFEDLESQSLWISFHAYKSCLAWPMMARGGSYAARSAQRGKIGGATPGRIEQRDRRHTCRTALRAWPHLVWLSLWQPVAETPRKKNTWWLSPSPFRSNRRTPVSTSKPVIGRRVRAGLPGLCLPRRSLPEGASC